MDAGFRFSRSLQHYEIGHTAMVLSVEEGKGECGKKGRRCEEGKDEGARE